MLVSGCSSIWGTETGTVALVLVVFGFGITRNIFGVKSEKADCITGKVEHHSEDLEVVMKSRDLSKE